MLSSEENPGLFTFLVGLIVLVMAAVGLSLLMDRRFQFSSGVAELRREVVSGDGEISELKNKLEDANQRMLNQGASLEADAEEHKELTTECESLRRRQAELVIARDSLLSSVNSLDGNFSGYRSEYRRKTWNAAVGESLGTLTLRSGRVYQQAVIRRVTDVGLEIHHVDGIARVQGPELDAKFQERFQWNDEERRLRLKEENDRMVEHAKSLAKGDENEPVSTKDARRAEAAERTLKRNELRQSVRNWKSRVSQLSRDQRDAQVRAGYGSKSVPGSLETWDAKAVRLGGELAKARAALSAAKAELASVSPRDNLLAPEEEF